MRNRASLRQLRRPRPKREPRARILLVCEGEKTERIYFSLFLGMLRAANVFLEIAKRECGSDPLSIIRFAKNRMAADAGIDQCYCVIDQDTHANFAQAVAEAESYSSNLPKGRIFRTIKSYPCFEFWFILHFSYTRAPFVGAGGRSAGDMAVSALREFVPGYDKSNASVIASLLENTDTALKNADKAFSEAIATGDFNPSTEVQILVRELNKFA